MNELEMKVANLKEEMANAKAEATAAKEAASAIEQKFNNSAEELKKANEAIDNLDASIKEQKDSIDALRSSIAVSRPLNWKEQFRQALEAKRPEIEKALKEVKAQRFDLSIEIKSASDEGTDHISNNYVLGVDFDPNPIGAGAVPNAFIAVLGIRQRRGNKIGWVEASNESGAAYVAELAQNTAQSDVDFTEKQRAFGKICTYMRISTELENWFQQIFDFCVNEGSKMIDAKIDDEIFNGAGVDGTYPNKIYGLKASGQSTAYTPIQSGSVYMANAADVLMDARMKVAQNGYNANVAFVSYAIEAALKGIKTSTGAPLYNEYTGMLNGLRIVPSSRLSSGEALVLDTNCVEVYGGNNYELEFIRNGAYDAYDVYFRKAAQVKVAAGRKSGIQYISNMTNSIGLLDDGTSVTLSLSPTTKSVVKGSANAFTITPTVSPTDTPVLWSSQDTAVATVNQAGVVTPIAAGTTVIIAQAGNVLKTCIVTVTNA